jgi:LEA14-like dessication related protein
MRILRSDRIFISVFLLLFTMLGCAGVGKRLEPPSVKLADIRLEALNVLEAVFDVKLRVFNTNDTALQIRGIECKIDLNGKEFAMGVTESEVEVPSYGTALLPLQVYSSVFDIIKNAADLPSQNQLDYRIKGKLRLGGSAFPSILPFESQGHISLPDLPESNQP